MIRVRWVEDGRDAAQLGGIVSAVPIERTTWHWQCVQARRYLLTAYLYTALYTVRNVYYTYVYRKSLVLNRVQATA